MKIAQLLTICAGILACQSCSVASAPLATSNSLSAELVVSQSVILPLQPVVFMLALKNNSTTARTIIINKPTFYVKNTHDSAWSRIGIWVSSVDNVSHITITIQPAQVYVQYITAVYTASHEPVFYSEGEFDTYCSIYDFSTDELITSPIKRVYVRLETADRDAFLILRKSRAFDLFVDEYVLAKAEPGSVKQKTAALTKVLSSPKKTHYSDWTRLAKFYLATASEAETGGYTRSADKVVRSLMSVLYPPARSALLVHEANISIWHGELTLSKEYRELAIKLATDNTLPQRLAWFNDLQTPAPTTPIYPILSKTINYYEDRGYTASKLRSFDREAYLSYVRQDAQVMGDEADHLITRDECDRKRSDLYKALVEKYRSSLK